MGKDHLLCELTVMESDSPKAKKHTKNPDFFTKQCIPTNVQSRYSSFLWVSRQTWTCPSLKTNAVSDPVLWTTGNRDADRDKTHDTSWKKCLIRDILD